jgi:uncharacterized protein (TIGR03083 family)
MDLSKLRSSLDADFTRLRQVAVRDLTAQVPNCPQWTVDDLVRHVAFVYLHKVTAMRSGAQPESWPPAELEREESLTLLDRGYSELVAEFDGRKPDEPTPTWYEPDQTVGFWVRRMAQETVIHRVDAEQALGEPVAAIDDELALDGIDEILQCFLAWPSTVWPEEFAPSLPKVEEAVLVRAGEHGWLVRASPHRITVTDAGAGAAASVGGDPASVRLGLWRRAARTGSSGPVSWPRSTGCTPCSTSQRSERRVTNR